jgi:hypothetical protein
VSRKRNSIRDTLDRRRAYSNVTLPDGRVIESGQEFTVKGEGRFTFAYEYRPDGSLTAFGPVGSQQASWRAFKPERVSTIHRSITPTKQTKKEQS